MVQIPQPLRRLAPARTVPMTRWRAPSRWRASPVTVVVLLVGLWLFGTGEALLVDAGLGVSPWTVLAQGVGLKVGIGVGFATFVVSGIVLLLWLPLRERPGLGTLSNAVVVAAALGFTVLWLPGPDALGWQLAEVLGGVAVIGLGSGLYLTTGLGPGPRDGWMTGLHRRTGIPVTLVRLAIEVVVLGLGWLLGGTVGVGTLVFALLVGAAVGYGLLLVDKVGGVGRAVDSGDSPAYEA
jgi:uncharacterized membrane protein YczE